MSALLMGQVFKTDLAPNLKLVLVAYADHANDDGTSVYPGEERMVAKTSYSTPTIRRLTRELIATGLLIQTQRGYRTKQAEFRINTDALEAAQIPFTKKGYQNDTQSKGYQEDAKGYQPDAESLSSDDGMGIAGDTPNHQEPSQPSENHHLATITKLEHDAIWDTAAELYGQPTKSQTSLHAKLVNELVEYEATPSEMRRRSVLLVQDWGKKAATLASLTKWWYRYDGQVAQVTDTQVEESVREQTREERRILRPACR